jgi:hypothetical protein
MKQHRVAAKWTSIRYLSASHNGWLCVVAPTVSEIFHFERLEVASWFTTGPSLCGRLDMFNVFGVTCG